MIFDKEKKGNITYLKDTKEKKINKKKLAVLITVLSIIAVITIVFVIYAFNEQFRGLLDTYVLRKNIEEDNLPSIKIENVNTENIFAYSNYIGILKENTVTTYNSSAKKVSEMSVEITTPLIDASGDYVGIAEKGGKKFYLIQKNNILWQKEVEGNISRINVNSNGYVSLVISGTSHKSVIVVYDNLGSEIFKTYLASTIAVDTDISEDNKYMGFAEVNISGTLIQSNIKVISIDKAKENPSDAIIYKYTADSGSLIMNVKYQNKGKLVCMYDDSIHVIENEQDKKILDIKDQDPKITFADIELKSYAVTASEASDGLFSTKTAITLLNTSSEKSSVYNLTGSVKELYCYNDKVGINVGADVHFVDMNGWLIKKYTSTQEIRGVVISNNLAGIIHKNKIEIINL